jgi:hypothetical protein
MQCMDQPSALLLTSALDWQSRRFARWQALRSISGIRSFFNARVRLAQAVLAVANGLRR